MEEVINLARQLASLAKRAERELDSGSRFFDGGWRFYFERRRDKPTLVIQRGHYGSGPDLTITTLVDGTLTVRFGRRQFRMSPDDEWTTRLGRDEWSIIGDTNGD